MEDDTAAAELAHNRYVTATETPETDATQAVAKQAARALALAGNAKAAVVAVASGGAVAAAPAQEESVRTEVKMLENLVLQEVEVKRKLDASFQSTVVEEMSRSKTAIAEARAREKQLSVRELELEVRLERKMREQHAELTAASADLTRQMGAAAMQQQVMASEALKSAAAAQVAATAASRGTVARAVDYLRTKNVTAAVEQIRKVRAGIADTIRSKDTLRANLVNARGKVVHGLATGLDEAEEAARPAATRLAEGQQALRMRIAGVRHTTSMHRRAVDEKFAKVIAPRLRAATNVSGVRSMDVAAITDAHRALSLHMAGALRGHRVADHSQDGATAAAAAAGAQGYGMSRQSDAVAEMLAFLAMVLPLVGWLAACGYLVYEAAKLGYSSLPNLVYFSNLFWCVYVGILFLIVLLLGQEPMADFHRSHPEDYLVFQFLKAALFGTHVALCLLLAILDVGAATFVQLCVAVLVQCHYYRNAWVLAMMDRAPTLGLASYAAYLCLFCAVLSLSKSKLGQKHSRE